MLPMADAFHADRSLISVSVSIFMITTGIVQFFVGFFIDRFSVRKIMALGAVCISASFWCFLIHRMFMCFPPFTVCLAESGIPARSA